MKRTRSSNRSISVLLFAIAVCFFDVPVVGQTESAAEGPHACDVLTTDTVKSALNIAQLDAKPRPGRDYSGKRKKTYTSCLLVWPSDKKEEREVMGRKIMMDAENRIHLSVSIFEPGNDQTAYNAGAQTLKQKYETQAVEGVGDEALWVPKMNQISVRGGGHVFHLSVEYPDGEKDNLESAKKLAGTILQKLGQS